MADGSFPTLVSKDTSANSASNPIYIDGATGSTIGTITSITNDVNIADGGNTITVDGTVAISGSVTVTATDLDIRSLVQGSGNDNVTVWANTAKDGSGTDYVPLVDADGKLIISNPGGTYYTEDDAGVTATGPAVLAERDDALGGITPAEGDWSKLYVNANGALWVKPDGDVNIADGGNTITVDGTVAATQSGGWDIGTVTTVTTVTSITNDVNIADGGNSITVDASQLDIDDLNLTDDAVRISGNTSANSETNPIFVKNVAAPISGNEVHDYATSTGTGNNDYTVTGTTFLLKSVILAASGGMKAEIQTGPVASLATKAVGFIPHQGGTQQLFFDPAIEVPATSTGTVRVVMTNREGASMDVYSTIIGNDIA
jgi:hypothetical protein